MVRVRANAKINLTLDILGKYDNGYHEVEMVMQSIDLFDTIVVLKAAVGGISLRCSGVGVPCDSRNLAYQAAEAFFKATGLQNPGILIDITKRIPIAAGLAGGSTDAAAVLAGLNDLFKTGLDDVALCRIGGPLGADIPFCLTGGTLLAKGTGTELKPMPPLADCLIVLAKPKASIKTASAYADYDQYGCSKHPDTEAMIKALTDEDIVGVAAQLGNVLEDVAKLEVISHIEQTMLGCGAQGSRMSGSGPSVFGIFLPQQEGDAKKCQHALRTQLGLKQVFLTKPAKKSLIIV